VAAVIPVGQLWVGKLIIDQVVQRITGRSGASNRIWVLVAYEVGLAVLSDLLSRAINLCDSLLGDKFTNHVSLRLMEHANRLDLVSFEDPVFYDKLERARRQTTSRLGMLAVLAGMGQQVITLLSLSAAVVSFSPWFLLLLVIAVIPAFLGETRFAMLAYSILYRWTPERRELDYLRMLGASNQSAKEVKIFGLGQHLADRSRKLFDRFYAENKALAVKRAASGSLLNRWILRRVYCYPDPNFGRCIEPRFTDISGGRFRKVAQPHRKSVFQPQQYRRTGSLYKRFVRFLRN
jgi:ATP-binding cassette subfamily B protein